MTGFTQFESSMGGKWLDLLKETAPHVERCAGSGESGEHNITDHGS